MGISLATASHGFFDGFSTYGAGVAFFLPFTTRRFVFPWRPLSPGSAAHYPNIWAKVLAGWAVRFSCCGCRRSSLSSSFGISGDDAPSR